MCCLLVSGFFTEITQQIHSLRASGVISSHFAHAAESEMRTFRKSAGILCTEPGEIVFFAMGFHSAWSRNRLLDSEVSFYDSLAAIFTFSWWLLWWLLDCRFVAKSGEA
jgi:hypothetical protein